MKYDERIQNIEYLGKLKPYIGIVFKINNLNYYVPISSVKEKHYSMKEDIDFIKIIKDDKILGVLNLNNMIPIHDFNVKMLKYKEIEKYRSFNSEKEKRLYISFLNQELSLINQNLDKIKKSANKLYNIKTDKPYSKIAKRSCDFRKLEEICLLYNKKKSP